MTMNTYNVISGDVHEVTAASEERALEVFYIWNGYQDGDLTDGETCGHGDGETVVLPDTAPVAALLTALDAVSWIMENWYAAHEDDDSEELALVDALYAAAHAAAAAIRGTVN